MGSLTNAKSLETSTIKLGKNAVVREFLVASTVTAGKSVSFDESQTGENASRYVTLGGADCYTFGIALETVSTVGATVRVLVGGYMEGAFTDGNIVAGSPLTWGANGALVVFTEAMLVPICGVAFADDSSTNSAGILLYGNCHPQY